MAKRSSDRSSARPPRPQVAQGHPRVAKGVFWPVFGTATLPTDASVASSRGEGVIYRVFGTATLPTGTSVTSPRGKGVFWPVFGTAILPTGTSVASSRGKEGLLAGLRHDHPAHRYFRVILVWRDGHPPVLCHAHHAHRHFSPIPAWRPDHAPVSDRSLHDALASPSAQCG